MLQKRLEWKALENVGRETSGWWLMSLFVNYREIRKVDLLMVLACSSLQQCLQKHVILIIGLLMLPTPAVRQA